MLHACEGANRLLPRIAVSNNSAYDLYLKRNIKYATLVRGPSPAESLAMFLHDQLEAAAGVRQPLERFAAEQGGLRVIEGRFTTSSKRCACQKTERQEHTGCSASLRR